MLVEKDICGPDEVWYTDADGCPQRLTLTPSDVQHFYDQGQAMLAAGLSIPVPLEHDRTLGAKKKEDFNADVLRNNTGWVDHYKMVDGRLKGVLDIKDPKIAAKLPHTIKWTSPWINSFVDGDGRQWNGVISHVALTSRPRLKRQTPFPSVAAALSLAPSRAFNVRDLSPAGLAVSRAGAVAVVNGAARPVFPRAFSIWSGATLAVEDMIEEKKVEKKPDAKPPETPPETPPAKPPVEPPLTSDPMTPPSLVDGDGDISVYTVLADLLHTVGIELPDGTDANNFAERLYTAAMEKAKGMGSKPPETPPMLPTEPKKLESTNPIIQEQPPMFMSLEQVNLITDPEKKAMAQALLSLQTDAAASKKLAESLKSARLADGMKGRTARIERLKKRLTPESYAWLVAQCKDVALSLDDSGGIKDPVDVLLTGLEMSLPNLPLMLSGDFDVQPHPTDTTGQITEERAAEVADRLAKAGGVPDAKKAG